MAKSLYKVTVLQDNKVTHDEESKEWNMYSAFKSAISKAVPYQTQASEVVIAVKFLAPPKPRTPKQLAAQARMGQQLKQRHEERRAWEKKLYEQRVIDQQALRRQRIINQIELAFEKKGKEAVKFVTCDQCSGVATKLLLSHSPEGTSFPFEHVIGALCDNCDNAKIPDGMAVATFQTRTHWMLPDKPVTYVRCSALEFFYDGLRQIHINN